MGGTKGYRSYRGRASKGKIALAVLLVLIILGIINAAFNNLILGMISSIGGLFSGYS